MLMEKETDMPRDMKAGLSKKIGNRIEERNYQEQMKRAHEREMLEEFARAYDYDVYKHQPYHNNGEIDIEYLQAHIARCRAQQEELDKKAAI